jgi:predicted MPP superfamily phosphohydrolase
LNTYSLMRLAVAGPLLLLFLWAQRYWFLRSWRFAARLKFPLLRPILRVLTISGFGSVAAALAALFFSDRRDLIWRFSGMMGFVGFWITTAFLSWVIISLISGTRLAWNRIRPLLVSAIGNPRPVSASSGGIPLASLAGNVSLDRRRFIQAATALAGAAPFGAGAYGFLIGRRDYRVSQVDLPVSGMPKELDGLRIAQLSDIHIGSYISAADVRRAVGMANELQPDLSVVTGDFITGPNDPLRACISELARLRAPLGVWGCNGNHEIYADTQHLTAELFAEHGMKLLRQENAEINWRGGKFNLVGVDYQLARNGRGRRLTMLAHTDLLMRRDMPNILLSHNPNSFPRAAELGIELMLTGHTHGGQVRVEILDHRFSPAQFLTPYIAGLYKRPLGSASALDDQEAWSASPSHVTVAPSPSAPVASVPAALVYVNRGLGTIGAPVRLGVPPEISLLTLRCV